MRRAALLVLLPALAACGGTGEGRQPAETSVERLAAARYRGFSSGGAHVTARFALRPRVPVVFTGDVDWREHRGGGRLAFRSGRAVDLVWDRRRFAMAERGRWTVRPLAPDRPGADRVFALLLRLASDRPDNPQTMVEAGAARLRGDRIGDRAVEVFRGPAARAGDGRGGGTEYWLGEDGRFRRVVTHPAGVSGPLTVDLESFGTRRVPVPEPIEDRFR